MRNIRSALGSVLADESFNIPTKEAKTCLEIARGLVTLYRDPSIKCVEFSSWLNSTLQDIIVNSTKRNGLLNAEKLWGIYHETTSSKFFREQWELFLDYAQQLKEPLFYQHITDVVFECLVKEAVVVPEAGPGNDEHEEMLTFEEENAVRYVGGYVIHSLKNQKEKEFIEILINLSDDNPDSNTEGPAQEWTNAVDRGGLTHITTDAYQFFYSVETCIRRYLKFSKATEMNDEFRKYLTNCILNDGNVLFYWCLAGQDEDDEVCNRCLMKLVEKWITIRGFSFVNNMMEIYKQEQKKCTVKSKSLRSKLFT